MNTNTIITTSTKSGRPAICYPTAAEAMAAPPAGGGCFLHYLAEGEIWDPTGGEPADPDGWFFWDEEPEYLSPSEQFRVMILDGTASSKSIINELLRWNWPTLDVKDLTEDFGQAIENQKYIREDEGAELYLFDYGFGWVRDDLYHPEKNPNGNVYLTFPIEGVSHHDIPGQYLKYFNDADGPEEWAELTYEEKAHLLSDWILWAAGLPIEKARSNDWWNPVEWTHDTCVGGDIGFAEQKILALRDACLMRLGKSHLRKALKPFRQYHYPFGDEIDFREDLAAIVGVDPDDYVGYEFRTLKGRWEGHSPGTVVLVGPAKDGNRMVWAFPGAAAWRRT